MRTIVLCVVLVFASLSFAKGGPCKDDRKNLCAGIEKGKGQMGQCLF